MELSISATEFVLSEDNRPDRTRLMTILSGLNLLPHEMNAAIKQLSGGQKAKILLASFDYKKNNILVLDEPTRNISPTSNIEITKVLKAYPGSILTISHDWQFLHEVCDVIYELDNDALKEVSLEAYE
ncbi:ATP-binding cassette domain-containing protein [Tuanshanicoccus lijuaniae]|uniref:ATP-binding cassette domain-containing protein n=1 Tax=Aerococcaceae bacterium zg-1292 TaxID=2774330 RepID=UPI001BD8ECF8|nr:ATP-binding cassette domain-containing protein [Aerococcaceae bacterium zg-A91]MBS4457616.1 ATP-binding cassette domain-containing protein [Aerococcaceae bacterium zg-BR33]